jgi:hypothetical protein
MHTSFEDMMKRSATIAVAKLVDSPEPQNPTCTLDFVQVLKGTLKPGKHKVSYDDYPNLEKNEREFVVFLDEKMKWRFVATPLDGTKPMNQNVLEVRGFYNWNAHFVTPGLVTIEQLQGYIKDRSLVYRFRGAIYFPQAGKLEWKASSLAMTGSFDAVGNKVDVKGLPKLEGFPVQPQVHVHGGRFDSPGVELEYSRSGNRPLMIASKVDRLDSETGEFVLRFFVIAPEVLTQNSFEDYLSDEKRGPCYHTFRLQCAPTKDQPEPPILKLTMAQESSVTGWGKEKLTIRTTSYSGPTLRSGSSSGELPRKVAEDTTADDWKLRMTAKTATGDYLILVFDIGEPKKDELQSPRWVFRNDLLYAIYSQPIRGLLQLHDGRNLKTITTFTITLDATHFAPK